MQKQKHTQFKLTPVSFNVVHLVDDPPHDSLQTALPVQRLVQLGYKRSDVTFYFTFEVTDVTSEATEVTSDVVLYVI